MKQWICMVLCSLLLAAGTTNAQEIILDDFDYDEPDMLYDLYSSSGTLGTGEAFIFEGSMDETNALELYMEFEGGAWGSAGVQGVDQEPFSFGEGQKITLDIKGEPVALSGGSVLLVFQFRDAAGEVFRFLEYPGPKSAEWTTVEFPFRGFEEGPWDANPDVASDHEALVSWEFVIQGVGSEAIDPYETSIFLDNLKIVEDVVAPPVIEANYVINKIAPSAAPNVEDTIFDAIYAEAGQEISSWEDDSFNPVANPYSNTRAYLITDGTTLYVGFIVGDPDTSTLVTDTDNDTLTKWETDSWEIVFAPNPGTEDGPDYIKFAGDSAGYWDDISPDTEGGTDWDALSFKTSGYIINANTWAAEFSVDIADIDIMFTDYDSYGHIGMQVKDPAINFAFPLRSSFGSRDAHWDFSSLDETTPISEWSLY